MRKTEADVLRALRGELNPDENTRAAGDVAVGERTGIRPARVVPRSATEAASLTPCDPRELPYDPKVGVLPESELRRLLLKHANAPVGRTAKNDDRFTVRDIATLSNTDPAQVRTLKHDMVTETKIVPIPARKRISQCLLRLEAGLIVKRNGVVEKLSEPEKQPARPEIRRRVLFSPTGKVMIVQGDPAPKARPFPTMLNDWIL